VVYVHPCLVSRLQVADALALGDGDADDLTDEDGNENVEPEDDEGKTAFQQFLPKLFLE